MNYFYWDASALGKRYTSEAGTPLVNHLFTAARRECMTALSIALGELASIIVRRHNTGVIGAAEFATALANLRAEVTNAPDFPLRPTDDDLIRASLPFIEQYSLNATDALVLRSALDAAAAVRPLGNDLVLVAADARLLAAARAEGLLTFNPESGDQATLDALIAT